MATHSRLRIRPGGAHRLVSSTGAGAVTARRSPLYLGDRLFVMAPRPGRIHSDYELPFAEAGLTTDSRELKASPEFASKREEILSIIWEMEEEIMGRSEAS